MKYQSIRLLIFLIMIPQINYNSCCSKTNIKNEQDYNQWLYNIFQHTLVITANKQIDYKITIESRILPYYKLLVLTENNTKKSQKIVFYNNNNETQSVFHQITDNPGTLSEKIAGTSLAKTEQEKFLDIVHAFKAGRIIYDPQSKNLIMEYEDVYKYKE